MTREVHLSESQDEPECEAILATWMELGDDEGMQSAAKDALGEALEGTVRRGCRWETLCWQSPKSRIRGFLGAHPRTRRAGAGHPCAPGSDVVFEVEVGSLGERVSSLTTSLDAYKLLRNRFISTFKRDKLGTAGGNAWAHGGDAVVDAMLYRGQGPHSRRDLLAYKRLYGFYPLVVLGISQFHLLLYLLGQS